MHFLHSCHLQQFVSSLWPIPPKVSIWNEDNILLSNESFKKAIKKYFLSTLNHEPYMSVIQNKRIFAIHFFSSIVALELCQDLKNFYLCWFFLDEGNYHHRYYVTVCVLMSKLRHLWATGPEWVGPQQWID